MRYPISAVLAVSVASLLLVSCDDTTGPLPATQISIDAPLTAVVGDFIGPITVSFRDVNGNVVTSRTDMVSLSLTDDPSGVALMSGTLMVAAVSGVATFDDISIDTPGDGFELTAASGLFVPSASNGIDLVSEPTVGAIEVVDLTDEDDHYALVPIGFSFPFYGVDYTEVWINTNGLITLGGTGCDEYENTGIPSDLDCDGFIAPFWDDLDPSSGGEIYYATLGSEPDRTFVVEWRGVAFYDEPTTSTHFCVVIFESSGDVAFEYGEFVNNVNPDDASGAEATIGFENQVGDDGLEFSYNAAEAFVDGRVMRFSFVDGNFMRVR